MKESVLLGKRALLETTLDFQECKSLHCPSKLDPGHCERKILPYKPNFSIFYHKHVQVDTIFCHAECRKSATISQITEKHIFKETVQQYFHRKTYH